MVFSTVEGGEAGGSILSPSLLSVSLKMSGLDLETKKLAFLSPKFTKVGPPCHLGTLMRSGQFCSRGTTLADCWLSKEDQRDSLGGKSPEKYCVFFRNYLGELHLGLKRQRRTRTTGRRWRRSSLKRMYKAYMASLGKILWRRKSFFLSRQ